MNLKLHCIAISLLICGVCYCAGIANLSEALDP